MEPPGIPGRFIQAQFVPLWNLKIKWNGIDSLPCLRSYTDNSPGKSSGNPCADLAIIRFKRRAIIVRVLKSPVCARKRGRFQILSSRDIPESFEECIYCALNKLLRGVNGRIFAIRRTGRAIEFGILLVEVDGNNIRQKGRCAIDSLTMWGVER